MSSGASRFAASAWACRRCCSWACSSARCNPDLKLPEIIYTLGLVLFVYTIGLSSGRGFFAAFKRKGLRDNALVLGMLIFAAILAAIAHLVLSLSAHGDCRPVRGQPDQHAGAGRRAGTDQGLARRPRQLDQLLAEPVIGYSVTYPMGVIGLLIAIGVMQRVWKIDYRAEEQRQRDLAGVNRRIFNRTIHVTQTGRVRSSHSRIDPHAAVGCDLWARAAGRRADPGARLDEVLSRRSGHGGRGAGRPRSGDGVSRRGKRGASGTRSVRAGLPAHHRVQSQSGRASTARSQSAAAIWRRGHARAARRCGISAARRHDAGVGRSHPRADPARTIWMR